MIKILYNGLDSNTNYVWGYLSDRPSGYVYLSNYFSFWGKKSGNIYFHCIDRMAKNFPALKKRKEKIYKQPTDRTILDNHVSNQFSQYLLLKKLRNGNQ